MTKEQIFDEAEKIQGWFPRHDMETLYSLAKDYVRAGGLAVEVGSWKGRSSFVLASLCQQVGARLICIDSFKGLIPTDHEKWELYHGSDGYYKEGNEGSILEQTKKNLKGLPVTFLEGNSTELHKKIKDGSASLVFIDGDHDMPIVALDMENFKTKVKKGGVLCGHDYEKGNTVANAVDGIIGDVHLATTIWFKPIV